MPGNVDRAFSDGEMDTTLGYTNDTITVLVADLTPSQVWWHAILAVTAVSFSSIVGIVFIPLLKKTYYTTIMRLMIGLAIGSLTSSALFHLIPAALGLPEYSPNGQRYINILAFAGCSAWIVFIGESLLKISLNYKLLQEKLRNSGDAESFHILNPSPHTTDNNIEPIANGGPTIKLYPATESEYGSDGIGNATQQTPNDFQVPLHCSTSSVNKSIGGVVQNVESKEYRKESTPIKPVAWIVIIGDSIHNFIDGIAIGAGFVESYETGLIISLAVLCEELPHELGDFAILINSGLDLKKALLFNFSSALTCYLGMILGILLGQIEGQSYIFAFAAGIFLYVALGDMVPEVTSVIGEVSEISPLQAVKVLTVHNIGILIGVSILYLLAIFQID